MATNYSVKTDQYDYAPGATALITATGVELGSAVTFSVQHVSDPGWDGVYGTLDDTVTWLGGLGHEPWVVVDGGEGDADGLANGTILTSWYVDPDDSLDETFLLTASGPDGIATTSFTDALQHVPVPAIPTEANSALFETYEVPDSTGTGVINAFVRVQDANTMPGFEAGYNTDGRPVQFNEDTSPQNNFSLRYVEVPKLTIDDTTYLVLNLDLNESNANFEGIQAITLQNLKIFSSNAPDLTDMDPTTRLFPTATLNYELDIDLNGDGDAFDDGEVDHSVDLTDWNTGSGTGDYRVLIPVAGAGNHAGFADVAPSAFIYVYSEFGVKNCLGWAADGGFEEWFVMRQASMSIEKTASVDGDVVDEAGDLISYTVVVTNTGSEALTGVTVSDPFVTDLSYVSGDLNENGILDMLEAWTYTATHLATQDEIDDNGGGDGYIDNLATADSNETESVTDSASVLIEQNPAIAMEKVTGDGEGGIEDGDGVTLIAGSEVVWTYRVTNAGNTSLSNVTVTDDNGTEDTLDDFLAGYVSGDADEDGKLDVDEQWIFTASATAVAGSYANVATAEAYLDNTAVTASDSSSYEGHTAGGLIAPTGTSPEQYIDGTAMTFQEYYAYQDSVIQYGVKNGKISQTNPGVFFYFTGATGDIQDGNNDSVIDDVTIEIDQSRSESGIKPLAPLNDNNIKLYKVIDDGDGLIDGGDTLQIAEIGSIAYNHQSNSPDYGDLMVTFTPEAEGMMYILSVKYTTTTAVGSQVGSNPALWPSSHYDFSTYVNDTFSETYADGIDLAPKQASLLMLTGEAGDGAFAIRSAQTKAAYQAALSWWEDQGYDVSALKTLSVQVEDLGDVDGEFVLGMSHDGQIIIDDDAANHGWSLGAGRVVAGKVDLVSVLAHEMGHLLGLEHDQLGESLAIGVRQMPALDAPGNQPLQEPAQLVGVLSDPSAMPLG